MGNTCTKYYPRKWKHQTNVTPLYQTVASPFQDYFSNRLSKLSEAGGEKVGLDLAISVDMDVVDSDSDWL